MHSSAGKHDILDVAEEACGLREAHDRLSQSSRSVKVSRQVFPWRVVHRSIQDLVHLESKVYYPWHCFFNVAQPVVMFSLVLLSRCPGAS